MGSTKTLVHDKQKAKHDKRDTKTRGCWSNPIPEMFGKENNATTKQRKTQNENKNKQDKKTGGKVSKLYISFSASNENPAVGNENQETLDKGVSRTENKHERCHQPEKWVVRAFRRVTRGGIGLLRHDIHENKTFTIKRKTRSLPCRMERKPHQCLCAAPPPS